MNVVFEEKMALLNERKDASVKIFTDWRNQIGVTEEEMPIFVLEDIFLSIVNDLDGLLKEFKEDLKEDKIAFLEFMTPSYDKIYKCYEEVFKFMRATKEEDMESKELMEEIQAEKEQGGIDDKVVMLRLYQLAEMVFYHKFRKSLLEFYEVMETIISEILAKIDEIFVHHFGQEFFEKFKSSANPFE